MKTGMVTTAIVFAMAIGISASSSAQEAASSDDWSEFQKQEYFQTKPNCVRVKLKDGRELLYANVLNRCKGSVYFRICVGIDDGDGGTMKPKCSTDPIAKGDRHEMKLSRSRKSGGGRYRRGSWNGEAAWAWVGLKKSVKTGEYHPSTGLAIFDDIKFEVGG